MAKEKSENTEKSTGIMVKILESMQKHRKVIFIVLIALVVFFIGAIIFVTVRENLQENALVKVDDFERRYAELLFFDEFGFSDADHLFRLIELNVLLDELREFQRSAFGFASARAHVLSGDIHWEVGNLSLAENSWLDAARTARNSYLEPISFFNAAIAAEEQGNIDTAIAHFERALAGGDDFLYAARAQFAIGRLEESRNNVAAAIQAYETLLMRWFNDPVWANLAQSRIIALSN